MKKSWPESEPRLPIKLEPVSNGEFFPIARPEVERVRERALADADEAARRKGVSRRELLASACGAATTLLAMNQLGCGGGRYRVPEAARLDEDAAAAAVGGDELVFDVQTHHVNPARGWHEVNRAFDFLRMTWADCRRPDWVECYGQDAFVKEVYLDSDTDIAVLSALAGDDKINPLLIEEAAATRAAVEKLPRRLLLHGIVMPNLDAPRQLEWMQALKESWNVAAYKLYTVWGPGGKGYWLDDPKLGLPTIERARALGVTTIAIHKGIPLPFMDPTYTRPRDVGVVARMFPDMKFLIYHSGYEHGRPEGPYDPGRAEAGIDALVKSLADNGIGPGANVYAELGATWQALMQKPDEAAHALGKLMKAVGEDHILWGTDCIWFGSPQDQIQAFRAFEISPELQEKHGYPALTAERKAKIFGLNAAAVYGVDPAGPRTRREVLAVLRNGP